MKKCFTALLLALCFWECFTSQPNQISNTTLRYGIPEAPTSLDPATAIDLNYYQIAFNIFETLIGMDWEKGVFVPQLATSWQSDSTGMQWTFSLRRDVVFHDGSPLNAEAVKISFERQFDANSPFYRRDTTDTYGHFAFSMIKEIRAVNDSTVQFILKYPYSAFLDNIATPNFATIVSPRALEEFGETFGHHPVGTGPFQFESWEADSQIVIKKFERYWGKPAQLERVIYKIIPYLEEKLRQLRNGELEVMCGLSPATANLLYHARGVKVVDAELIATVFICFNYERYPFSEVKIRRAVAHAIDKNFLVRSVSQGFASVAKGGLPPLSRDYDSTLTFPAYDPQAAKALLQSAGYHNGTVVQLPYAPQTDTLHPEDHFKALKGALEKIGISAELVLYRDWETYRQDVLISGKYDILVDGWMGYTRHPDNFLYPLFHSQAQHNFFKYKNPQVDALLEQARRAPDEKTQRALYREVQKIIARDVPVVFFSHPKAVYAIRDRVKNFRVDPLAIPWLHEVRLEDDK